MSLISSQKIGTNEYEIEVKVEADVFKAETDRLFKQNAKKIKVDGFRPGKAPKHIIEKIYGKGIFFEEAVNNLYPTACAKAIQELELEPVSRPELDVKDIDENGFNFIAKFFVKPEISVKDYKGVTASKTVEEVSDEKVTEELDKIAKRNSRLVSVEGRAAQLGDQTIIDFEGFVDSEPFPGGKGEAFPLTLGSNQFIPGFEEQVVGKNVDEEFDVNVTFPEEYHAENIAGKPAVFKVKLHDIKQNEMPVIDDEFAKDVSEFDSLDEYKNDIKSKLELAAENKAQADFENALIDKVIENIEGEIPEVMYDNRVDDMVADFEQRLASQGLNLDTYLHYTGMSKDSFRKTFQEQSERQVKIRLALEKIAEYENLTSTDEELEAEYVKIAEAYKTDIEQVKKYIPAKDITADIVVNKAIDLVRDNAVQAN